ncbi:SUMO-activating enzyme subunit 2 [Tupaia chinensis]|uniref:SUMO-activating enzyme subunit 2 n=1 Tax=Tupaia chinensis TaxID=246437 RepID=L8Y2T0_TUPCH|nr:SUMO-activating enzyme subunit 2 [Tupaia chinensis]
MLIKKYLLTELTLKPPLFKDDIRYLLTMDKLWRKRKPPVPLDWAEVQSQGEETSASDQQNEPQLGLKDQQVLDVKSYAILFSKSIETLRVHLAEKGDGAELIWDKIVKEKFAMVAPDVQIEDGKGTILISSEEGETEANNHKKLSEFGIRNGSRLQADDFLQDYTLLINILHSEDLGKDVEFEVVGDAPEKVGPKQADDATKSITNGSDDGAQPSTSTVDSDEEGPSNNADISEEEKCRKRKLDEKENVGAKRSRIEQTEELDDVIALD